MGWGYMRLCCHLVGSRSLIEHHLRQNGRFASILDEKEYCGFGQIIDAKLKALSK